jgi:N-acetylneuraminic acid mutarotase
LAEWFAVLLLTALRFSGARNSFQNGKPFFYPQLTEIIVMRKLSVCFAVLAVCLFGIWPHALAQTGTSNNTASGEWTWMGGSSTYNYIQPGVYGALGTPAAGNIPGGRTGASRLTDSSGHLWLFGGCGFDANGNSTSSLNDLWEFDPSTNLWAWMGGSSTGSQPGVYGTLRTPAAGNIPGSRCNPSSWTDSSGNLWLFGGWGRDANGNYGDLSDLWEFNPSTNQWAWMGGNNTVNQPGVYGALGTPAAGNIPGSRADASTWIDGSGHLWLFGGDGYDANGSRAWFDDLWEFNPSTNEWAWVAGSSTGYNSAVYGTLGTPTAGNTPGSRFSASTWTDSSGNLWLFGGQGYDANHGQGLLNDLWEFYPSTNEWAWMGGSSGNGTQYGLPGVYGTLGTPAAGNIPGSRANASTWIDSSSRLWLFGGDGYDANGNEGVLNDLWEFNLSTNQWAWMGGSSTDDQSGVYGTLGTPDAGNIPGSRADASTWIDGSGHLWLFSGDGIDVNGASGNLNDLWEYQPPPALPAVATPTFSLASGTYSSTQSVTISDTTPNATIYYTTDGTWPTTSSAVYGGPISVSTSEIIKAMATADGYAQSAVATAAYSIPAASALRLTSSLPSSISGQPVAFTATVTSGATGTITFNVNNGMWSITAPIVGNIAELDTSELPAGSDTIVASYSGDFNWKPATSSPLTQVVNQATPSITLSSSLNPSAASQRVAFTATLNVTTGTAPTGTIIFNVDNGMWVIPATINGLTAVLDTSYLTVGSHTVVATYNGDSNWTPATSSPLTQAVNQDSLTLTSSVNPSSVGQMVAFTASLNGTSGAAPTGTITFNVDNGALSIPATVTGYTAVLDTSYLSWGAHTIVATYSGDSNWRPVTSSSLNQFVDRAIPTLTLSSSANPSTTGQLVAFTANLNITSGPAPTGIVTFYVDNWTWVIPANVVNNTAVLDTSELTAGTHTIVAWYGGDSNWNQIMSAPVTQTVNASSSN